jgi:tRNA (cytidine/uridine-2'-O-)-methyltransferase
VRIALFQPDIPQNVGAAIRLTSCLGVGLDIIEPCGFALTDKALRRSAMDYGEGADIQRHDGWSAFVTARRAENRRLVLLTTRGATPLPEARFEENDVLLLGRESAGVPDFVHEAADLRVVIPLAPGKRSLNVVVAGAIVLGEGLRQSGLWPQVGADTSEG